MIFEQIAVGGDRNFAYLIADETALLAAVIDPAYSPGLVLERVRSLGLELVYLINTHGHDDHAGGNAEILAASAAELILGSSPDIRDGHEFSLGQIALTVIRTPGHTADSLCILARDKAQPALPGKLITGDTLFVGKVGGTDFEAGARAQYDSLHDKLLKLPGNTEVWPGHDVGAAPQSTIEHERMSNPFLLRESFGAFVDLKQNWLAYKQEHGIE